MKLKRTPIKEIIFNISFNETIDVDSLTKFKNLPHILEKFPLISKGFHTDIQEKEDEFEATVSNDGYILKTEEGENKILRILRGSFAFHKVKKYEKFDSLLQELKNYWSDFEQCIGQQLTVNLVTVRYLNFIEKYPTDTPQNILTIYPQYPAFANKVEGFVHLKFEYPQNNLINVNIVTADAQDNEKHGIILDIFLNRKIENENNISLVFDYISELRDIKNNLFFTSITETTKNRYNQ